MTLIAISTTVSAELALCLEQKQSVRDLFAE
jgi:hypothetical protein